MPGDGVADNVRVEPPGANPRREVLAAARNLLDNLLALQRDNGRYGVFIADAAGKVSLLYGGEALVAPVDLDLRGDTLLVADRAAGDEAGGLVPISLATGAAGELVGAGYRPGSVTVAIDGSTYFSGADPQTGEPGLFKIAPEGAQVSTVFAGALLVDPSGIAPMKDGVVLVADTRLDGSSEAGIYALKDGEASLFASEFAAGYPAGIALTTDESTLII